MMHLCTSFCLVAVVLAVVCGAHPGYGDSDSDHKNNGAHVTTPHSRYGSNSGAGGSKYDSYISGAYPSNNLGGSYHGGGYRYGGYHQYSPPVQGEKQLTELDKLYQRMTSVLDQIKTYEEEVDALSAQLSVQVKKLKDLEDIKAVQLMETDTRQDAAIVQLQKDMSDLMADTMSLASHVDSLEMLNVNNIENGQTANNLWAQRTAVNVMQTGQLNMAYTAVTHFKDKLFQVMDNKLAVFMNTVERDTTTLESIKTREKRRMCESGQVTLSSVDLRAEYQYQSSFDSVPQVTFGLCGFQYNLDSKEDKSASYGGYRGYGRPGDRGGYGGYYEEPEAIGVRVNAYSTKTGLTLEAFDKSFGDTSGVSVDVCFQACTMGPGTRPVSH